MLTLGLGQVDERVLVHPPGALYGSDLRGRVKDKVPIDCKLGRMSSCFQVILQDQSGIALSGDTIPAEDPVPCRAATPSDLYLR